MALGLVLIAHSGRRIPAAGARLVGSLFGVSLRPPPQAHAWGSATVTRPDSSRVVVDGDRVYPLAPTSRSAGDAVR